MNKKITVSVWLTTLIIAITVTFSITMTVAMNRFDSTVASVQEKEIMYSKIAELDKYIRANSYYPIDEQMLHDTISTGYVYGTGDPFAEYYTAEEYTNLLDIQTKQMVGLGAQVILDPTTGYAKIMQVYAGSPLYELGVEKNFYITKIGETDVKNITSQHALENLLLDAVGTSVEITWLNAYREEQVNVITRHSYVETTVQSELLQEKYGYIDVRVFDASTAGEIDQAISKLKTQGATSLIFDLRDNEGGIIEETVRSIDIIAGAGTVATALYGNGDVLAVGKTYGKAEELPIVVLVNENTASSAELFADSARRLANATIVGTQTYGKGTIQSSPHRLSDGSAVVMTVAEIYMVDGKSFNNVGIAVDVESVLTEDEKVLYYEFTVETDPQINDALEVLANITGESSFATTKKEDEVALEQAQSENVEDSSESLSQTDESSSSSSEATDSSDSTTE